MIDRMTNGPERDHRGRFAPGNRAAVGRGNPHADRVAEWRAALADSVSGGDLAEVLGVLVAQAKAGEPWAVKELLNRCFGRPAQALSIATAENPAAPLYLMGYLDFIASRAEADQ